MTDQKTITENTNKKSVISLLLLMVLLGVFPIDVLLPSVPAMALHFNRPSADIALSISLFAIGISFSQLLIGPLSDRTGRKNLLLLGMIASMIGAMGCALSSDYKIFILFRIIQALGCGCFVLSQALVQDLFEGKERDSLRIMIVTASGVFISISPLAGSILQELLDWRGSFYLFFVVAAVVFIKTCSTLKDDSTKKNTQYSILRSYSHICRDKLFFGYWLIAAIAFSCHFSFIVVSPLIFMEQLQLSQYQFSAILLLYGVAYAVGGTLARVVSNRTTISTQIAIGFCMVSTAGLLLIYIPSRFSTSPLDILLPMVICTVGITTTRPAATSKAMERFPNHSGTSASVGNTLIFICGGLISMLINFSATDLLSTLGWTFLLLSIVGLGLNALVQRPAQAIME
ncbi:arabinose efflux permease family protein [Pseudomonas asplenii]|uniref:Arabinose efflux permease family protein n=1 Tax=Pseudomonas asplenii TaxID=53407 RepID=A0A0N0E2Z9_9PSED|nr:MFS transporter [Pseudomonas fuscovaginae]KPA89500.1 arabinose efflux permease family protein [Pseudomonas fuscovaginae]